MGIPWDGTGINCYGMGQINMSHGQPCPELIKPVYNSFLHLARQTAVNLYRVFHN